MNTATNDNPSLVRRIGVAALACALTVVIAGSTMFLVNARLQRNENDKRIQQFVDGLELLSRAEIAERTKTVQCMSPAVAQRYVTLAMRRLHRSPSERLRLAIVRFVAPIVPDEPRLAQRMFELRMAPDETVAAEAVQSLAQLTPATRAAENLARCLDTPVSAAVTDVVCDELVRLGDAGRAALQPRLPKLSPQRRWWLAGFIFERQPANIRAWLALFEQDSTPEVRGRVWSLLTTLDEAGATTASSRTENHAP